MHEVITTVGGILASALIAYMIRYASEATGRIKDERLRALLAALVAAAEKQFGSQSGSAKLAYVSELLSRRGVNPDDPQVRALLEAEVLHYDIVDTLRGATDCDCEGDCDRYSGCNTHDVDDMDSGV